MTEQSPAAREPKPQRRMRKIAMTSEEVDAFLAEQRTCRAATNGTNGPHATPLWYLWDAGALWFSTLSKSQRWTDLHADSRIAVVVDAGHDYAELRGVEIRGTVEVVGEVPRTGEPNETLERVERLMGERYFNGSYGHDGRHAWMRVNPDKITSWDFRKIPQG